MSEEGSGSVDHGHAPLSSNDLFYVLSDSARRTVLFHLRQHGVATLDELLDVLEAVSTEESGANDRINRRTSLVHSHLPLLKETNLLTYDRERDVVESTNCHDEIGEWLDLAVRQQLQYEAALEAQDRSKEKDEITVLFVDDEPGLPETVGGYIERENDDVVVTAAASTHEAVSILEETSFDCIVSDYQMPAISGLDFLKVVREQDATQPFIVFTARGSEQVASEAISTGVTDYIEKGPTSKQFDVLVERIREAVAQE
jgi:CheY-like chemotaxis protein